MDLAKVIGTVVATQKSPELHGVKLCILQPLDETLSPSGPTIVATDATAKRGPGEIVYYVVSAEASFTSPEGVQLPSDAAIGGIVDHLSLSPEALARRAK